MPMVKKYIGLWSNMRKNRSEIIFSNHYIGKILSPLVSLRPFNGSTRFGRLFPLRSAFRLFPLQDPGWKHPPQSAWRPVLFVAVQPVITWAVGFSLFQGYGYRIDLAAELEWPPVKIAE